MHIKKLVKKEVASLSAYSAKEIPCSVKLDANESPYGFEAALRSALSIKTNRYPDPEAKKLKAIISKELGVPTEMILQGNGSDEIIYNLIVTFGGPVLYPIPTFSMYGIISKALGEKIVEVTLEENFDLDVNGMLSAIRRHRPKIIFLSSPNNPTGNCFSSEKMLRIIEKSNGIVVVDEAYQPFSSNKGFLPLLKDHKNIVIMRTLSKIGLAALRLGFIVADAEIINEVNKVRLPFNVNALSQAVAAEALKKKILIKNTVRSISIERDKMFKAMQKINGVRPFPSEANFILFRVTDAKGIYSKLLKKGILVRDMSSAIDGCLRVTVGTPKDNSMFLSVLEQIL